MSRGAARRASVRIDGACELVAAAAKKANEAPAPSRAHLPEPTEPAPVGTFKDAVKRRAGSLKPYQIVASDFDVAFITPVLNYAAQSQSNQTFSNSSDYVADIPPVLFIRVTPKMLERFWAKMARGAAYTQEMALPAIKRLKSGFDRLQAFCGRTEVTPIHPFTLELRAVHALPFDRWLMYGDNSRRRAAPVRVGSSQHESAHDGVPHRTPPSHLRHRGRRARPRSGPRDDRKDERGFARLAPLVKRSSASGPRARVHSTSCCRSPVRCRRPTLRSSRRHRRPRHRRREAGRVGLPNHKYGSVPRCERPWTFRTRCIGGSPDSCCESSQL
jgi:hypothetical protein